MALKTHGSPYLTLQHGWTVDEDEHGLLAGECTWEGDIGYFYSGPGIGSLHPYDGRLTAYRVRKKRLSTNKCEITLGYIGLAQDPTPWNIEHPGGSGQDPIETHPLFSGMAGTASSPLNGAVFDPETDEFIGFADPTNNLCGVRSYIVPSVMINASYYTHYAPNLGDVGRITSIPPIQAPRSVRNFLLIGQPYRQIGNVYQITNQYLGSGPGGWNTRVY